MRNYDFDKMFFLKMANKSIIAVAQQYCCCNPFALGDSVIRVR